MRLFLIRKRPLAVLGCLAAAAMMFLAVGNPTVVGAAATTRQLPIHCVQKDYKVLSISFDAAWGDVKVRRCLTWLAFVRQMILFCIPCTRCAATGTGFFKIILLGKSV